MVSTEDPEIAEIAKAAGANVPFMRPSKLATDTSSTIEVLLHVIESYEAKGHFFDALCLLQPTVPFRKSGDLEGAIEKFKDFSGDSLVTMRQLPHIYHPDWIYVQDQDFVHLYSGKTTPPTRRQNLSDAWYRDGSIYLVKWSVLKEKRSLYGDRIAHYEMKNSPNINIDTLEDWKAAELYLRKADD